MTLFTLPYISFSSLLWKYDFFWRHFFFSQSITSYVILYLQYFFIFYTNSARGSFLTLGTPFYHVRKWYKLWEGRGLDPPENPPFAPPYFKINIAFSRSEVMHYFIFN